MIKISLNTKNYTELIMGQSPSGNTYNKEGKGLPFFQGKKDFGLKNPITSIWCSKPKKIAQTGDILLSVRAPVGSLNIADKECAIGRGLAIIKCKNNIIRDYVYIILKAFELKLESEGLGGGVKAITKPKLESLRFFIPKKEIEIEAINKNFFEKEEVFFNLEKNVKEINKEYNLYRLAIFKEIIGENVSFNENEE